MEEIFQFLIDNCFKFYIDEVLIVSNNPKLKPSRQIRIFLEPYKAFIIFSFEVNKRIKMFYGVEPYYIEKPKEITKDKLLKKLKNLKESIEKPIEIKLKSKKLKSQINQIENNYYPKKLPRWLFNLLKAHIISDKPKESTYSQTWSRLTSSQRYYLLEILVSNGKIKKREASFYSYSEWHQLPLRIRTYLVEIWDQLTYI